MKVTIKVMQFVPHRAEFTIVGEVTDNTMTDDEVAASLLSLEVKGNQCNDANLKAQRVHIFPV